MEERGQKLYFGIDLGTTNSAISYGKVNGKGEFETKIGSISRIGKEGGQESKDTLPSVVYYKKDIKKGTIDTVVGDFAKNQHGKKYGYVMKSVKNYMGSLEELPLEKVIEDSTPEEVSARILKHLVTGIKGKLSLPYDVKDVIVTIPASFDPDMCKATLKAAEIAGLDVKLPNGDYKNILLYEPKAVIYNLSNMMLNGEIPKDTIDFTTKKNVLVFDLGGGTLDVALYSVGFLTEDTFPIIDDISVGRYSAIGGDSFDNLLADELTKKFLEFNNLNENDVNIKEIRQLMENKAEFLKLELSNKVFSANYASGKVKEDEEFEIIEMDLYKGYEFEAYLTKKEIEDVLKPIMGDNLTKDSVENIDNLKGKDINNIIYPILDVLSKGRENNNNSNVNIDAIVLNGGMTKFYLIQERIERFFGLKPIVVNDPDLSVAKGAAFYQYCLEKRNITEKVEDIINKNKNKNNDKTTSFKELQVKEEKKLEEMKHNYEDLGRVVLNETINLALEKGYVHPLVKAGTELQTGDIEFKDIFYIPKSANSFELPFYMGRGKTTELPNRKIASRIINLKKIYPINTTITLIINIDKQKNLKLSGYVGDNVNEKIDITIEALNEKKIEKTGLTKIATNVAKNLDAKKEIEIIKTIGKQLSQNKINKEEAVRKLMNIKNQISMCPNKGDFEKYILESINGCENSQYIKGYLLTIGAIVYNEMSDSGKETFKNYLKNFFNNKIIYENPKNSENIKTAIIILGSIKDKSVLSKLEEFISVNKELFYTEVIEALGKISCENERIYNQFIELPTDNIKMKSLIKAVGSSYSNQGKKYGTAIGKGVNKLLNIAINEEDGNNLEAIVSLSKILDRRFGDNLNFNNEVIEEVIENLEKKYKYYSYDSKFKEIYEIALNLMKGLPLTSDEEIKFYRVYSDC